MATIKDIAKHANLGTSTVSRYLNQRGNVSKDAADRIEIACKELNYIPNSIARSLRTRRTNMVALLVPDIEDMFFPKLAAVIEDVCISRGYRLILCNSKGDVEIERKYIDLLLQGNVDGVILSSNIDLENWIQVIRNSTSAQLPIVALGEIESGKEFSLITTITGDHFQGGELATNHLIEQGCNHLIHITETNQKGAAESRQKSFEKTCIKANVSYDIVDYQTFQRMDLTSLSQLKSLGIFAWTDMFAARAMKHVQSLNLSVPNHVKLVGYDDLVLCELLTPTLTSVHQPLEVMGQLVAKSLLDMIEDKEAKTDSLVFKNSLVVRESTGGK